MTTSAAVVLTSATVRVLTFFEKPIEQRPSDDLILYRNPT